MLRVRFVTSWFHFAQRQHGLAHDALLLDNEFHLGLHQCVDLFLLRFIEVKPVER